MKWFFSLFLLINTLQLIAQPQDSQVIAGGATFSKDGNLLKIVAEDKTILHWNTFSVDAKEVTQFIQPGKDSAVLNRVTGKMASVIDGSLVSNGKVYLINPHGVLVGPEGVINTGAFIASTLDVLDQDFLAGGDLYFFGPSQQSIVNLGTIHTEDGEVVLLAHHVKNEGAIETSQGLTALASGHTILLKPSSEERVAILVSPSKEMMAETGVENNGLIQALQTELKADGNLYRYAIRLTGDIDASQVRREGGNVFLVAEKGVVEIGGAIDASSDQQKGGEVRVLGEQVALLDMAKINASGSLGGGKVLIGGDYQGKNNDIVNSQMTFVARNAAIKADALKEGDGGRLIVWSDGETHFYGKASVRGGPEKGNGGFVEISGLKHLDYQQARVDRLAPSGEAGMLLLDPSDLTINAAGPTASVLPAPPYLNLQTPLVTTAPGAVLMISDLLADLSFGGVTVQTSAAGVGTGNITLAAGSPLTIFTPYPLTLDTTLSGVGPGDIIIDAPITGNGHGGIALNALGSITISATGSINQTLSGNVILTAGLGAAAGAVTLDGSVTSFAGDVLIDSINSNITSNVALTLPNLGRFNLTAGGNVSITNTITATKARNITIRAGQFNPLGSITIDGDVTAEQGDITLELFGTMGTISVSDNIQATGIGNVTLTTPQSLANDIVLGAAGAGGDIFVGTHVGTTTVTSFDLVMLGGGGVGLDTVLGSTASGPVVVNVLNNVSINGGTAGTATAAISTVSGPITVAAMNDVNLTGGTSAGATANIISTSGTVSVTGANINLTGGGNVTATPSIQSANDVTVLATTNIVLDGTATQAIPLIANSGGYSLSVTAGGSLTMSNSSRLSVASNYGALRVIASNITLNDTNTTIVHNGDGFLSINAVNNITINTAATMVHNGDGTMDVIAGFSTFLNGGSINQNGLGDLFVVVDNAAGCTAGGGGLTTAGGTNISTAGGALRIFTAQAANNPIAGNIQGAGFAAAGCPPGPDEQCGSCFLLNSADAGFPFTVFYKVGSYPTPPPAPPCSGCDCSGSGGCP